MVGGGAADGPPRTDLSSAPLRPLRPIATRLGGDGGGGGDEERSDDAGAVVANVLPASAGLAAMPSDAIYVCAYTNKQFKSQAAYDNYLKSKSTSS